jgi:hypothetical protein
MRDSQMRELGFFNRKNFIMEKNIQSRDKRSLISQNLEFVIEKKEIDHKYLLNRFNLTNSYTMKSMFKYMLSPSSIYQKNLNDTMLKDKTLHRAIRDSADENYNILWFDYVC